MKKKGYNKYVRTTYILDIDYDIYIQVISCNNIYIE